VVRINKNYCQHVLKNVSFKTNQIFFKNWRNKLGDFTSLSKAQRNEKWTKAKFVVVLKQITFKLHNYPLFDIQTWVKITF